MSDTLSQQDFVRRLVEKKGLVSWLIGAGSSVSANMPTATDIVWDLKKKFYCAEENQEFQGNDIQVMPVREKIQSYLDSKRCPPIGSSEEYSFYFKLLFGNDYARQRDYLQDALSASKISESIGQRVLAGLIACNYIPCVYSTNFDEVVERSYGKVSGGYLNTYHIEGSYAALDALNNNQFPIYVKLHGDFRYKSLRNLEQDLKTADECLGKSLLQAGSRFGFFVVGYSGRDRSVMDLMSEILNGNNPYPHGLYWGYRKGSKVAAEVESLIGLAREKNVESHLVEIDDYVALMSAIWKQVPDKPNKINQTVAGTNILSVNIPLPPSGTRQPVVRFNCLPIQSLPRLAYRVTPAKALAWEQLKEVKDENRGKLIIFENEGIYSWGMVDDIKSAFGAGCEVSEEDISSRANNLDQYMSVKGAMEIALCKAIATRAGLIVKEMRHNKYLTVHAETETRKFIALKSLLGVIAGDLKDLRVEHRDARSGIVSEVPLTWSEAIQISITSMNGCYVVTFRPYIWISPPKGRELARDFIFRRTGTRKNDVLDKIVSAWVEIITSSTTQESITLSAFPRAEEAGKAPFQLITKTAYSKRA